MCNASANATPESPSLKKCLYLVLPLYNKIWGVLVRQRAYPVVVIADIKKASYRMIRICECQHDALRFHWKKSEHAKIEMLSFTRALSGLAPSPFLLSRNTPGCLGEARNSGGQVGKTTPRLKNVVKRQSR